MDNAEHIVGAVRGAAHGAEDRPLRIKGSGSKHFLGIAHAQHELDVTQHAGIVDHRPDELVVTARAGTRLSTLNEELAGAGQMLPFDPPLYKQGGTLGGAIATALAGPGRPWHGGARDVVLGIEIVNGLGQRLRFGGSVMKNVAGYDVTRLMTGARGTLGVILEVSVRLLPLPVVEETVSATCDLATASAWCNEWARQPLPITATCHVDGVLHVRLSGSRAGVDAAKQHLRLNDSTDADLWRRVRDHDHAFFVDRSKPLLRLSLPRGTIFDRDDALVEWGGCQAWLREEGLGEQAAPQDLPPGTVLRRFWGDGEDVDTPPAPAIVKYMRRIKEAFDPKGILNPGVLSELGPGT